MDDNKAGLPVSPSVKPGGAQGTGSGGVRSLSLIAWLEERRDNCYRIAGTKTGDDRKGWLEDGGYFSDAVLLCELMEDAETLLQLWASLVRNPDKLGMVNDVLSRMQMMRRNGEDAPAIQSPTPQQESKKGTQGGK